MEDETLYAIDRQRMVDEQLKTRDIRDQRVLDAMCITPRHLFVPPEHRHLAYADGPLPLGSGQTISQPYIVALMTQTLRLKGQESVLEIGTGSGYQAAVLAYLAREVHTIERHEKLGKNARNVLMKLELTNATVHLGDGTLGLPDFAPFDAILVTAAAPKIPPPLLAQLADGGRLVLPVGGRIGQYLECWQRRGTEYDRDVLVPVAFVPLRGQHGWGESEWDHF